MSSITADGLAASAASPVGGEVGPLEQKHLQNANYRAVAGTEEVTKTHWHIAFANALGWGFDGMDGVIFALISPLVIKGTEDSHASDLLAVVTVQDGPEPWDGVAREVTGEEKAQWWERAVAVFPDYADYQKKTDREIPVFKLTPTE